MTAEDWLLESDPAISWQARCDIVGEPVDAVVAERARVASRSVACFAGVPPAS